MADRLAVMRGRSLAAENGLPYIELSRRAVNPQAVRAVPFELLKQLSAVPFDLVEGTLHVALTEPSDAAVTELERVTRMPVTVALAAREDVDSMLRDLARSGTLEVDELRLEGELTENVPTVRAVNDILRKAVVAQASDIHLIPDEGCVHVRLRIDGVVQEHGMLTGQEAAGVISRIKVVAGLDVAEHRRPQDGRFTIRTTGGRVIDLRTTVLPTVHGEGIVLRLLGKTRTAPSFTDLGLSNVMQMELERLVDRAVGSVLVTGPTGSGKSTTLHAALADLARPERTVITIEDPVEYELPGTYQIQTNPIAGVTFPSALRTVLRGDPDVLMVGEIRDQETAQLALSASLSGHFVLSTLHTGDALSAVSRLTEMGVERYVVSAGLSGVIAQRLARRLCLYCREPYEPSPELVQSLGCEGLGDHPTFFRATGCPYCTGGHRGRTGIFQLLTVDDDLRALLAAGAPQDDLARAAAQAGMASLWDDGLAKVVSGAISLEELHRVVPR